jgi:hypothetical protein
MQPARHESSPLSGARIVGLLAVLLGAFLLLAVCAGGFLFVKSDYQAGYALLFVLAVALVVGGTIALVRG